MIGNTRTEVYEYARNSPISFMDSDGNLPETTEIITFLEPDDDHWQIQVFDVVFSFNPDGYSVLDPEECQNWPQLILTDVPREEGVKAVNYVLQQAGLPNLTEELINSSSGFKQHIGKQKRTTDYRIEDKPCASLIWGVYDALGLVFDEVWVRRQFAISLLNRPIKLKKLLKASISSQRM